MGNKETAMRISSFKLNLAARSGVLAVCAAMLAVAALTGATKQRPIKKLSYDPSAPTVELFDGLEQGSLDATLIPRSSLEGSVFIENKTDKVITVKLPKAVAAAQVLKQGFGGGGGRGGGGGGMGGMGGGMGGMGGGQMMGGGMGGGMMGGMGGGMGGMGMGGGGMMGGMGGGFFSIPPHKTAQLPMNSVCLEHGKAEPRAKMTYKLIKLEEYTSDPVLQELLEMVGTGKLDPAAAQAATWNLANNMSWEKLASKEIEGVGGIPSEPYFSESELAAARQIMVQAQARARERDKVKAGEESPRSRNRVLETKS
jgi:hypothetical protein